MKSSIRFALDIPLHLIEIYLFYSHSIRKTNFFYIKDTQHFINTLRERKLNPLPKGTLLCTLDVTSLYTNLPNEEGRQAVAHWLNKYRPQALVPPMELSNTSILSLFKMVIELNNFQFNGTHYLQIGGTGMGTRVAPTLANLFMGHFEETHVYTQSLQPSLWVRFIDDIFLIWPHGKPALERFIDTLNNSHRTIKFSSHISDEQVSFLDTLVIKDDNTLYTSLYTKPTDANNFLHFDSAHSTHCKKGIPCGQFLRIRRICAKDRYFLHHAFLKAAHFRTRGYPLDLIAEGLRKAWKHG